MMAVQPVRLYALVNVMAGQHRDERATALYRALCEAGLPDRDRLFIQNQLDHARLLRASLLTGAALMLNLLHGEAQLLPLDADQPARLRELLSKYGLLAEENTPL